MNQIDHLRILLPIGKQDHEITVLIITLFVVTLLAFSIAKKISKKVQSNSCFSRSNYVRANEQ